MELVFVYGTLRRGCYNNYLLNNSLLIDTAKTVEKYTMYVDLIPYVNQNIKTSLIYGEIYKITVKDLLQLDALERHPNWYERKKRLFETTSGQLIYAWIYFNNTVTKTIIKSGDFKKQIN